MSDPSAATSTPFTVFDYLGLAFILGPPGVAMEALMKSEPLTWSYALYGIPSVLVGAVCIFIGRNWTTLRNKVWTRFSDSVDIVNNSGYFITVLAIAVIFLLLSMAPLYLWPPNKDNQAINSVSFPSADDIANAIAQKLPKQSIVQPQTTAPTPAATPPFVNLLHAESAKWSVAEGLRLAIKSNAISQDCHVIIVRLQEAYPEAQPSPHFFEGQNATGGWHFDVASLV